MNGGLRTVVVALVLVLVLFGVSGVVAFGRGSPVSRGPEGTIAVLAEHSRWPNGSLVEQGGVAYHTDIYSVDVANGRVRNLTHDLRSENCSSWLRHGTGILFSSVPSDAMKPGPAFIEVVSASGAQRQRLLSVDAGAYGVCPALSPDGGRLLYVIESGRQHGLYVMRIDGTEKRRLTRSRAIQWGASWSPDGRQILFAQESGRSHGHIFVINADGSGLRELTRTKYDDGDPVWSPDGKKIAFSRNNLKGPRSFILTMRRDGTNVYWPTRQGSPRDQGSPANPAWMSNNRIVYQDIVRGRSWWTVAADGSTAPKPLAPRTRVGQWLFNRPGDTPYSPAAIFSPDGTWIAYWKDGDWPALAGTLWLAHEDGTDRQLASRFRCCSRLFDYAWAPS